MNGKLTPTGREITFEADTVLVAIGQKLATPCWRMLA